MSLKRFRTLGATGIFVLLLGVPVPAATAAPLAQSASTGGLYVDLGDSVHSSGNPTFPERLLTHYQSTLGVTDLKSWFGGTSEDLRTGGALASALEAINAESDTKVVTIDNGGHDALGGCDFTSPSCPFRANFSATLGDLQAALANDPGDEPLIAMA